MTEIAREPAAGAEARAAPDRVGNVPRVVITAASLAVVAWIFRTGYRLKA